MANLRVINVTANSFTVMFENLQVDASLYSAFRLQLNDEPFIISTSPTIFVGSLNPNTTFELTGEVEFNNVIYPVTGTTVTTLSTRPPYFSWTIPKISGANFNVLASEWNALLNNINSVRMHRNLGAYAFVFVSPGLSFSAFNFNQAVDSIRQMNPNGVPATVGSGDIIYAASLNQLVSAINSVT